MDVADQPSRGRRIGALAFLMIGYFFYAWSWNTVDILRPYLRDEFHLSLAQAGSLYSVQAIGGICGAIMLGQLADRIGRRNTLVIAMMGYGSLLVSGVFLQSYTELLLQRLALGFFMGAMYPVAAGLYAGLFAPAVRGLIAGIALAVYNLAVAALGFLSAAAFRAGFHWHLLLWAGLIPTMLALLAFVFIPDDRLPPLREAPGNIAAGPNARFPIAELFQPTVARQTILLAVMSGLNLFAYQVFTGWASTYLKSVRAFDDALVGDILGWQFAGAALGGLFWGAISDRLGRRSGSGGFLLAAGIIPLYLFVPLPTALIKALGFAYGVMLSASAIWGPWLSELYPSHLRSTAASIYNWGRGLSMMAPLITAPLAGAFGLVPVMALASICFVVAALIWRALPETAVSRADVAGV
ncbi:MFS transporter [Novosphingobium sp. AAP93]|uniref:MFS transporter n=1 Tax=Novosphingobium sp. AAP93 TaxID=1523427 RepID=UPI0006B91345|nr:MFS transporter [Novosphingobium sp. AAP93]KPF78699.1 hypothetical protein IP83_18065 [Novosphingobium sp. AAP93]